jgi:glycerol-3-phosphate acyltransferase PlsY
MDLGSAVQFAAYCLAAYLLGSVPFGFLLGRLRGMDIRQAGSRNIGATNCWRLCGWRFGLPAFVLDVAKGFVATFLASRLYGDVSEPSRHLLVIGGGAAAIVGHVFPLYLGFRGGKAVATSLGVFLGIPEMLPLGLAAFALWTAVFLATRYVSVASTAAAVGLLAAALLLKMDGWRLSVDVAAPWAERWPLTAFTLLLVAVIIYRHRENYRRLIHGTESKFGRKKNPADATVK